MALPTKRVTGVGKAPVVFYDDYVATPGSPAASGTPRTRSRGSSSAATAAAAAAATRQLLEHRSEIRFSDLRIGAQLGAGHFGRVFQARLWGISVAVKELPPPPHDDDSTAAAAEDDTESELAMLRSLRHPNVVSFLGCTKRPDSGATLLVMELLDRGSLHDLVKRSAATTPAEVLSVATQIAQGLRFLHEQEPPVFHRDLTSSNVLVDRDGVCKLVDFGLSAVATHGNRYLTNVRWRAPEVVAGAPYLAASDVFSLAMICYELFARVVPWGEEMPLDEVLARVREGQRPVLPEETPRLWQDIIRRCWDQDPDTRPTAKMLLRTLRNLSSMNDWLGPALSEASAPLAEPGRRTMLGITVSTVLRPGKDVVKQVLTWVDARVSFRLSQCGGPGSSAYSIMHVPKLLKFLLVMIFSDRRSMAIASQSLADDFGGSNWLQLADYAVSPLVFTTTEAFAALPQQSMQQQQQQQQIPAHAMFISGTAALRSEEGGMSNALERCRLEVSPLLSGISAWRGTFALAHHGNTEFARRLASFNMVLFFSRDPTSLVTAPPPAAGSSKKPDTGTSAWHMAMASLASVLASTPSVETYSVHSFLQPRGRPAGGFPDDGHCTIA